MIWINWRFCHTDRTDHTDFIYCPAEIAENAENAESFLMEHVFIWTENLKNKLLELTSSSSGATLHSSNEFDSALTAPSVLSFPMKTLITYGDKVVFGKDFPSYLTSLGYLYKLYDDVIRANWEVGSS